jgi:hypothetical protein
VFLSFVHIFVISTFFDLLFACAPLFHLAYIFLAILYCICICI